MARYFEDMEVGSIDRFGRYEVTREEVLDFAGRYDPQPFHLSDEAAAKSIFGRVAASGWHTAAMTMRMSVDHFRTNRQAGLGSPGIDELKWLKPVYPGDTLRCEAKKSSTGRRSVKTEALITVNGETAAKSSGVYVKVA